MNQVIQNYKTGILEIRQVPDPVVQSGRLLIKTVASAVSSGTEKQQVSLARKNLLGKAIARPDLVKRVLEKVHTDGIAETVQQVKQRLNSPVVLGYSAAGMVVGVGDGVSGFRVGDAVACGGQGVAVHAEMLSVPPTMAVAIPTPVDYETAAFSMVGAITVHAARLARAQPGEWIAVIGLGLLGLIEVQILRAWGYRVIGLDLVTSKIDLARSLGAEIGGAPSDPGVAGLVNEATNGKGVDATIITAGTSSNQPLELGAQITRSKGRIVATGLVGLDLPRHQFFERELELVVSRASGPGLFDPAYEIHGRDYPHELVRWTHSRNMAEFLRLVACGSVEMKSLITHRFDISEATEAYQTLEEKSDQPPIGIVLQYPSEVEAAKTIPLLPPSVQKRAPRSEIAIGLIGAGIFARTTLLPELKKHSVFHFSGVATTSGSSAEHTAGTFGFDYATADHREVLEDKDVGCVMIATRHDSHARLTAAALRAGKDVFVEKPLAMTVTELLEVAQAWRSGDRRLMVGFNRRHSPHSRLAKEFLDSAGGPTLLHFRINAGEVPPDSWVNDPLVGGGRVRGELCHFIDLAHYFLDEFPVAVDGRGLPARQDGTPVEDIVAGVEFPSGSVANFVYTARGHRSLPREHIEGFRGGKAVVIENFRKTKFYGPGAPRTHRTWRLDRGFSGELSAWAEALKEGEPAPVSFATYAASTLVTLAVAEAMASGSKVKIDQEMLARCSQLR